MRKNRFGPSVALAMPFTEDRAIDGIKEPRANGMVEAAVDAIRSRRAA